MINIPALIALIVFYVAILVIGLWAGRKSKKNRDHSETEQVLLAGRDIGLIVGIFTMTATWVGGGFINGTAEVINTPGSGLVWCSAPIAYSLSLVIGGAFFAKTMRERNYITMLDPFEERYGSRMTSLLYIPALLGDLFWSSAILAALGATLAVIMGLNTTISIIVSACIAIVYTLFGGLYSVVYTDVAQLLCVFFGLWLCVPFAMTNPAVLSLHSIPANSTSSKPAWIGEMDPSYTGFYIDGFIQLLLGGVPWQAYFQRVLSSKTVKRAQYLSYVACIGCVILSIPPLLIGAIAAQTDWNQTAYKGHIGGKIPKEELSLTLPLVLQYLCPTAVSVIGLGAVSAAVMSSSDSAALSSSSMLAKNVYKPLFRPRATEREIVWVIRVGVFIVGVIVASVAITVNSVYGLFVLCSDAVFVILFPQFLCIIHFKYSNTYGALTAYIIGWILRLCSGEPILLLPALIKYPMYTETGSGPGDFVQLFPFRTFLMLLNMSLLVVVSFLFHYLFKAEILPKSVDIFRCFQEQPDKEPGEVHVSLQNMKGSDSVREVNS